MTFCYVQLLFCIRPHDEKTSLKLPSFIEINYLNHTIDIYSLLNPRALKFLYYQSNPTQLFPLDILYCQEFFSFSFWPQFLECVLYLKRLIKVIQKFPLKSLKRKRGMTVSDLNILFSKIK